jgi:hypothetical protein
VERKKYGARKTESIKKGKKEITMGNWKNGKQLLRG